MTYPTIKIAYSTEINTQRVLFTSASIAHDYNNPANPGRQYLKHNFYILPYIPSNAPLNTIYLPDIAYHSIPEYWTTLATISTHVPFTAHQDLASQLLPLIAPHYNQAKLSSAKILVNNSLNKYFEPFWDTLRAIYPAQANLVQDITIHLTSFGSIASFDKVTKHNQHMHLYLRQDADFSHLAEVIILSLIKSELETIGWLWPQIQLYAAHLLTSSALTHTLPDHKYSGYHPAITSIQHGKYRQLTRQFLDDLNLAHLQSIPLKFENSQVYLHNQPTHIFGPKELALLKLLLSNIGTTISYETILTTIWPNDYEVTQNRITKLIERIRAKLKDNDISPTIIQAVRGHGYTIS